MKTLTRGQKAVLIAATLPMIGAGGFGAWGTYANITSVFHRQATAAGVVAAGEGATLVIALVLVGLTLLGQTAPLAVRVSLWLLPAGASVTGAIVAPGMRDAVVFAITPMAMTVSAEGLGLLARRIVVYSTGVDMEAQRRNAVTLRRIAYHHARAARHPWGWVKKRSQLKAWSLMSRVGENDPTLGSGLMTVQQDRITKGADSALADMLGAVPAHPELTPVEPVSRGPEPGSAPEPAREPGFEKTVQTALDVAAPEPLALPTAPPAQPVDQQGSREPVLSSAEPLTVSPTVPSPEPGADEIEKQITDLAQRLKAGERHTKTTAAEVLGVSQATAGRRLKEAKGRINEGTGFYP
ncbi:hypothetical protein [Streptomyces sp. NPDC001422]|uniref:hypothetical protein n=1 Tax=Streptomyces sp. NPDC001422 TaxID=3364575 RepID=UPI0036924C4D